LRGWLQINLLRANIQFGAGIAENGFSIHPLRTILDEFEIVITDVRLSLWRRQNARFWAATVVEIADLFF
jgi:hypothetical protein